MTLSRDRVKRQTACKTGILTSHNDSSKKSTALNQVWFSCGDWRCQQQAARQTNAARPIIESLQGRFSNSSASRFNSTAKFLNHK